MLEFCTQIGNCNTIEFCKISCQLNVLKLLKQLIKVCFNRKFELFFQNKGIFKCLKWCHFLQSVGEMYVNLPFTFFVFN